MRFRTFIWTARSRSRKACSRRIANNDSAAPRQLRRLRLGLQTRRGSNHSAAHGSESNSRSNVFQISRTSVCVSSRCWHALLLEMGNKCRKTTRVAHFRGSTLKCLRASACVPSRWKVLSGEFRRRPTALAIKFRKSDRVGRRGLSEPREDFSRLLTYAFPRLCPRLYPWLYPHQLFHPNFAAPLFDDTNNRRIFP